MPSTQPSPLRLRSAEQAEQLLLAHLPLVKAIARHYASCTAEPLDDLLQVGLLGLATAAQRYRDSGDTPFACFARPHVRGAILHHLRDHAWMVRLPRRQAERLQRNGCRSVDHAAPNQDDALALQQWNRLNRAVSLEWLQAEGDETCLLQGSGNEHPESTGAVESYVPRDLNPGWRECSLKQMLNLVDARQREVLTDVILKGWSYRRTADSLGVSAPTVQRTLHQGLERLRQRLREAPSALGGQGLI